MDTITVSKVIAKDGNKPWKVYDGNSVEYVTWDDGVGAKAEKLSGEKVKIIAKVTEKEGAGGQTFVNRLLESIEKVAPEPQKKGDSFEPSVNFGKQVVIIRQNAWSQTNAIYDKATALYKHIYPVKDSMPLDMQAVHAIAWQLYSSNKRPEMSNMQTIADDIARVIREYWFPLEGDEIPFDAHQESLLDETITGPPTTDGVTTPVEQS
jgi:hypothetical protein